MLTIHVIQSLPHLTLFGNRLYLKQATQIANLAFFFQTPLKFKNGRVLKKRHGKHCHQTVMEPMFKFTLLAQVVDRKKVLAERLSKRVKLQMLFLMQFTSRYIDQFSL
jgi:hypothetical protein